MKLIKLTQGFFTKVDDEDFDRLSKFKWHYHLGYSKRHSNKKEKLLGEKSIITMSSFILKPKSGFIVDHINHDSLDNRRSNLRICSQFQNSKSQKNHKKYTSKYQGLYKRKNGSWAARIKVNYKYIHIGSFKKEEHAALAYNDYAKKLFGEFAVLNDVPFEKYPTKEERIKIGRLNLRPRVKKCLKPTNY